MNKNIRAENQFQEKGIIAKHCTHTLVGYTFTGSIIINLGTPYTGV